MSSSRLGEHALIEREPGQLAIEIKLGRIEIAVRKMPRTIGERGLMSVAIEREAVGMRTVGGRLRRGRGRGSFAARRHTHRCGWG